MEILRKTHRIVVVGVLLLLLLLLPLFLLLRVPFLFLLRLFGRAFALRTAFSRPTVANAKKVNFFAGTASTRLRVFQMQIAAFFLLR